MTEFSDYIVYVDESGDHNLSSVYPDFPVFCLAFCVIEKEYFCKTIVPRIQKFKFDFWGYDSIILHEHEIRKSKGNFTFLLTDRELRENFYERLSAIMVEAEMMVFASVIRKDLLKERYSVPENPYNIALLFCMERLLKFLIDREENGKRIHVVFESRGRVEDKNLEIEFRRICDNKGNWGYRNPDFRVCEFEPVFVQKAVNSTGLQLADLVARPIALKTIRPEQMNRAYKILEKKLQKKVFP